MRSSSLEITLSPSIRKTSQLSGPWWMAALLSICLAPATMLAQTLEEQIPVGNSPDAVAVNPTTNKIYIANYVGDTITVIDGATANPVFLPAGAGPFAIAINAMTDKIYVANALGTDITVIDGKTNATSSILVGRTPKAIAVNPVTNKIYVASVGSGTVTVIDGATNGTTTIAAGVTPRAIAVNTITNRIYVANYTSNNVTVVNGATNTTSTIPVGTNPDGIAVNPVTNSIYVANAGSANVTVINGATAATTTVAAGSSPYAVAVNQVSNKIYVANYESSSVTVIDGVTNTPTSTVRTDPNPSSIAVNTFTNQIYITQESGNYLYVIDGASAVAGYVSIGNPCLAVAVNPTTNKIYVANQSTNAFGTNNVAVLDGSTEATYNVTNDAVPDLPVSVALNPVTNKIYVVEQTYTFVTGGATIQGAALQMIDGYTKALSTLSDDLSPAFVGVNPVTNLIYVSNVGAAPDYNDPSLAVIDGTTGVTTTLLPGVDVGQVTVNPVTNKIYVANPFTVIDGATNAITAVPVIEGLPLVINPVTNKIYTVTGPVPGDIPGSSNISYLTVVDGSTNAVTRILLTDLLRAAAPLAMTMDTVTNKIFVESFDYSDPRQILLTVVDGNTNAFTTYDMGSTTGAYGLSVNQLTGKVYLLVDDNGSQGIITFDEATTSRQVNRFSNLFNQELVGIDLANNKIIVGNVIIDVSTYASTTINNVPLAAGSNTPRLSSLVINPIDQSFYFSGDTLTDYESVISPQQQLPNPLNVSVTPLAGNVTSSASPTFTFTTTSSFSPTNPPVQGVYYQLDTKQGPWLLATGTASTFSGQLSSVPLGTHVLYYYAANGSESTDAAIGENSIGAVSAYAFTVTN